MKKFLSSIIFTLSFFFLINHTKAASYDFDELRHGICGNKGNSTNYCTPSYPYNINYSYSYADKYDPDRYLGYSFIASGTTLSNSNEDAFCLDAGIPAPNETSYPYTSAREIDIDGNEYDNFIYKAYQWYVNSYVYDGKTPDNKKRYMFYIASAIRTKTFITPGYAKKTTGQYIEEWPNLANFISSGSSSLPTYSTGYFGDSIKLKEAQSAYQQIVAFNDMWENPLVITPSVTEKEYDNEATGEKEIVNRFEFEIKFNDGESKFFDSDYDIGFGNAVFGYNLVIEGGSYNLADVAYGDDYSGEGCFNGSGDGCTPNSNSDTQTIYIEISEEKLNEIISATGKDKVDVALNYEFYHPMSDENIFLNYYSTNGSGTDAQRMLVFSKFLNKGTLTSDGVALTTQKNNCVQEGNTFKIEDNPTTFEDYYNTCGCDYINYDDLSDENKTLYNNTYCPFKIEKEVTSNLKSCDVDSNQENYEVKYNYTAQPSGNRYCTMTCSENVNISQFVSKNTFDITPFTAGRYYDLPKYPVVESEKKCSVDIDYDAWKRKYDTYLELLIRYYNEYIYYKSCKRVGTDNCGDDEEHILERLMECDYTEVHELNEYPEPSIVETDSDEQHDSFSLCGSEEWNDFQDDKDEAEDDYIAIKNTMIEHISKLKVCNNYIINMGVADEEYYEFENDLEYHYEQDYEKYGLVWNEERDVKVKDIVLSDEDFATKKTTIDSTSDVCNYKACSNSTYTKSINKASSSPQNETIGDEGTFNSFYGYQRIVKYKTEYEPSVVKYIQPYTKIITDFANKGTLKNAVKIGNKYDLDITAKAKDDNENYYNFTSLGDQNKIYDYFKTEGSLDSLKRSCTYKIENDIITSCEDTPGAICDEDETSLNILYRTVDPGNIDPYKRINETDKGFQNWKDSLGTAVKNQIESVGQKDDTYNPKNLEYSFTLDSATLKKIREYNKNNKYSDFEMECTDGVKCESDFIDNANSGTGIFDKQIVTNISGRDKWKKFNKDSSTGKCTIDGKNVDC